MRHYIGAADAARRLGLTHRRVRQLCQRGEMAGFKVNARCWLVLADDVARRLAYRAEGYHRWIKPAKDPPALDDDG